MKRSVKTGFETASRIKVFLTEVQTGIVPDSWWPHEDYGNNQEAKKEQLALFPNVEPFNTPKPERLIGRILEIASSPGDWVLDSFAGSGTTGAGAHKMGRRWIMVELEETCHSHIMPRLYQVIENSDRGGVTDRYNWSGGGGFRYYKLAPSLLEQDEFGNWIINKKYNPAMLAEALCKLEGFTYSPSDEFYWQHGYSTETDFIYVTTQTLSREQLQKLNDDVGDHRSLLICCAAYRTKRLEDFPSLTIKKIPKAVMQKCEWGKDDYSLAIKALPDALPADTEPSSKLLADLPRTTAKPQDARRQPNVVFDGGLAMNPHVNSIAQRLSLRKPQRDSLEILARVCEIIELDNPLTLDSSLESSNLSFPRSKIFEREFPSLCFALATASARLD